MPINWKKTGKNALKISGITVLGTVGMSAVLTKYGLHAVNTVVGGMVNSLAKTMAGSGMGGTPLQDLTIKTIDGALDGIHKATSAGIKKIKEM